MSGAALSAAFSAIQVVYAAYRDVKSNKERCTTLVKRTEFVVEQLQSLVKRQGEELVINQIGALQSAFEETAQVIRDVGHQNWFMALLNADRDAVHIEHCHRCLTDLIALCKIEQGFDQRSLQHENERARQHDHEDLFQAAQSIQSELANQGEMVGEVLEIIRSLPQSQSLNESAHVASQNLLGLTRQRSGSPNMHFVDLDYVVVLQPEAVSEAHTGMGDPKNQLTTGTTTPQVRRRRSWKSRLRLQRLSTITRKSLPESTTGGKGFSVTRSTDGVPVSLNGSSSWSSCAGFPSHSRHQIHDGLQANEPPPPYTTTLRIISRLDRTKSPSDPIADIPPKSRSTPSSPCGSSYVEIRYYPGDMLSGVLLSHAFKSLGQTSLSQLRLASSDSYYPTRLARLNERNFIMQVPGGIHPADMLHITPVTDHRSPIPIVWVLESCEVHLEPVGVRPTEDGAPYGWALVPCDASTHVEDVMQLVENLSSRKVPRCFRREEHECHQVTKSQLLRDCGVRRGMYLEVELG